MLDLVGQPHRHAGSQHGEELGVLRLSGQIELRVVRFHLLGLAVPFLKLLLGGLLTLPLPLGLAQGQVFPLELLELLVLLHAHAGLLAPVRVIVLNGGGQLAQVPIPDLVPLHQHVQNGLLLGELRFQILGLPEPAVNDPLGVLGVLVLVLPVHHGPIGPALVLQSVGRGLHALLLGLLPGGGRRGLLVPGGRRLVLLAKLHIAVLARTPPLCGGCLIAPAGGSGVRLLGIALSAAPCALSGSGGCRPGCSAVEQAQVHVQNIA